MTITPLKENDPRLRHVCAEVTLAALRSREQQAEIEAILDYVYGHANNGVGAVRDRNKHSVVGLSGNQVGIMKQICVVDLSIGRKGYQDMHVLVNPRIVWRSKSMVSKHEGCVNFPSIWGQTSRSRSVRVEAIDRSGNEIALKLVGWPAVLLQHEIDHLNGRLFIDRLVNPTQADLVSEPEYKSYRRARGNWPAKVDVSDRVVAD
jgi:peptide deformylase